MNKSAFYLLFFSAVAFQARLFAQEATADVATEVAESVTTPKNLYPTNVLARPFTLPRNAFETGITLKADALGGDKSSYSLNSFHFDYGVTDDFQIGFSWGGITTSDFSLESFQPEKSISLNMGYFLFAVPHLASMVSLSVPFHFNDRVVEKTSLALPTSITMIPRTLAFLVLHSDFIVIDWRNGFETEFNFPIKLSYQATSSFIMGLSTNLGKLNTNGSHSHIGQKTPVALNATYAITNAFDVVARAGFDDAQKWRDSFSVVAGIAYRFGALDG